MTREIHCEGAPRDLGLDQGRAFAIPLRSEFDRQSVGARWRQRLGARTPATAALVRDLRRHFPQHSEALEGMVSGARVPYAWFAEQLARELLASSGTEAAVAASRGSASGVLIARSFGAPPCIRRSRPEGGFASLELTAPWYASSFAGVNEGGLAVAGIPLPPSADSTACAVPAAVMVQDCLARFDSVRGAVDWCTGRPAGGCAVVLLADATGSVAGVAIEGDRRRELLPKDDWIEVNAGRAVDGLRTAAPKGPSAVAAQLGRLAAAIDPARRRIELHDAETGRALAFEVGEPSA